MGWVGFLVRVEGDQGKLGARLASSGGVEHGLPCSRRQKFLLGTRSLPSDLYLFGGDQGAELMDRGLVCGGSRFEDLGSLFQALRLALLPK